MAADDGTGEVKPSFSVRYVMLNVLLVLITVVITSISTLIISKASREEKIIDVSTRTSQNLAMLPETAASRLETYLSVSPGQKERIRSLFRYEITIANNSGQGVDDLVTHFVVPSHIILSSEPEISSRPPDLVKFINIEKMSFESGQQSYKTSLLNHGQNITFSYFGYAASLVESRPIKVFMQKRDWRQNDVEKIEQATRNKGNYVDTLIHTKLIEMTWIQIGLLGVTLAGVFTIFRVYSSIFTYNFRQALERKIAAQKQKR